MCFAMTHKGLIFPSRMHFLSLQAFTTINLPQRRVVFALFLYGNEPFNLTLNLIVFCCQVLCHGHKSLYMLRETVLIHSQHTDTNRKGYEPSFPMFLPTRILFQGENSSFGELVFSRGKMFNQKQKLLLVLVAVSTEGLMQVFSGFKREWLDISLKTYLLARLLLWVETFPYWCFPGNHYYKPLWTRAYTFFYRS